MTSHESAARKSNASRARSLAVQVTTPGPTVLVPPEDEIRSRAHAIYQARCASGSEGDELADWIAAECELKARGSGDREIARLGAESSAARQSWRPPDQPVEGRDRF